MVFSTFLCRAFTAHYLYTHQVLPHSSKLLHGAAYAPTTMPYLTAQCGLGVSLGSRFPTSHPPSHPLWALPCSTSKTPTTCWRWRVAGCPIRSLRLPSVGSG